MKRLKGFLGVLLIFVFGVIVGVVLASAAINQKLRGLVEGGPDKVVDVVANRLRSELKLDESQREMLQQIVVDTRIKLSAIRQKTQPEVAAALAEAEQRVRGILNPDQVRKFDEIVQKGHEKWHAVAPPATPAAKLAEPPKPSSEP
jgi:hypothetical protein